MEKNPDIENDMIGQDHRQSNGVDTNDRDHDHVLDIIDRNITDGVDHDHHEENDVLDHVHLDDVRVQVGIFFLLSSYQPSVLF